MPDHDVRLERVTKRFHDVTAVDDVTLRVERGEFFSLLGPSGCGKTTTLRLIGGFETPTSGTVHLGEVDVTALPPYLRDVNTVFQSYALFPHLNVFGNVAFGLRRREPETAEVRRRVAEMLDLVELPGYEDRRPSQLSGGQQQRVALARALINRPRVLLLDEPLGALDLKLRRQMQLELKRIQADVGITFVHVTHDQEEAMTMSDRIGVMRAGRIEQIGIPEELYERPRTSFVAGFLGISNLLDGMVTSRDDELATVRLRDGSVVRAPAGEITGAGQVQVGVRPEKLRVIALGEGADAAIDPGLNALAGTILDASYAGVSTQYLVETGGGQRVAVYAQNLETVGAGAGLPAGQRVRVTWRPEHTFVVDAGPVDEADAEGSDDGEGDEAPSDEA